MSMTSGSITINVSATDGSMSTSGSGMAQAIGSALLAQQVPAWAQPVATMSASTFATAVAVRQQLAASITVTATGLAQGIVAYIQTNAVLNADGRTIG